MESKIKPIVHKHFDVLGYNKIWESVYFLKDVYLNLIALL